MTSFWDSRFVVTGGSGFLGGYVVDALRKKAKHVHVPSRRDGWDLREPESIRDMFEFWRPDVIIHLAAVVGGIGANMKRPADFLYDNLMMGAQLIHEASRQGVKKFVTVGTVCAYPKHTPVPFREEDLWNGYPEETNAPYGLAKKLLLVQGQAYRQQYGLNCIYLLPTNLYGPHDNFDEGTSHVIPALIKRYHEAAQNNDEAVTAWGDGSPTREFLYAADAAEGIVLATEHYDGPEPVNLGSGHEISIRDLSQAVAREVGYEGRIDWDVSKPNGQPRRALDTSRARELFGFQAHTPFAEGLRETVDWYLGSPTASRLVSMARPANSIPEQSRR